MVIDIPPLRERADDAIVIAKVLLTIMQNWKISLSKALLQKRKWQ